MARAAAADAPEGVFLELWAGVWDAEHPHSQQEGGSKAASTVCAISLHVIPIRRKTRARGHGKTLVSPLQNAEGETRRMLRRKIMVWQWPTATRCDSPVPKPVCLHQPRGAKDKVRRQEALLGVPHPPCPTQVAWPSHLDVSLHRGHELN